MTSPEASPVGLLAGTYRVLFYDYVENMGERRGPSRPSHLAHIDGAKGRGELITAGAVGDPPHGGLLVFGPDSGDAAERFAATDPYAEAGLITGFRVVPWTVVP